MGNKEILSHVHINGVKLTGIKGNNLYGEIYRDPPGVNEVSFWRDVVHSDLPNQWFGDRLDMSTIEYSVSPGQYNIGCDIYARGKLINIPKETVQQVKDILKVKKELYRRAAEIEKERDKLYKEKLRLNPSEHVYIDLP